MNPSHEVGSEAFLRVASAADLLDSERVARVVRLEEDALGRRASDPAAYYRPLKEFRSEWEHVDLFAVRDASQRSALDLLQPDGVLTELAEAQLAIFDDVLVALRPKVVVVINAMASAIFKKRAGTRCALNEQHGEHNVSLGAIPVPVFFSGMLTGRRALDVHSRERLVWHVRAAHRRSNSDWRRDESRSPKR